MKKLAFLVFVAGALLFTAPLCVQSDEPAPTAASLEAARQAIFTPAPQPMTVPNCQSYCQVYGYSCRASGGQCKAIQDEATGQWYCGCYYP